MVILNNGVFSDFENYVCGFEVGVGEFGQLVFSVVLCGEFMW